MSNQICGTLTANVARNCANTVVAGNKPRLILINLSDIQSITYANYNSRIIEAIVLKSGKKAYEFDGYKTSVGMKSEYVTKAYGGFYKHTVTFTGFDLTEHGKKQYEAIDFGQVLAIVEHVYTNGTVGDAAFSVCGKSAGLWGTTDIQDKNDDNTGGSFAITVATFEPQGEPHHPSAFFKTDYATTKGLIDAMIYSGTSGS